jgi:hypothetical protein
MTGSGPYKRPVEIPFLEEHRECRTVLFGTLTPKHEAFIRAVFRGAEYKCENLPRPTRRMHDTGREFCNNGLCNPNYLTALPRANLFKHALSSTLSIKRHSRMPRLSVGRAGVGFLFGPVF